MKKYHVLVGVVALGLALSSGVVISKNLRAANTPRLPTAGISTTLPIEEDALGDVGDELVASCETDARQQAATCAQRWAELKDIASATPEGLR